MPRCLIFPLLLLAAPAFAAENWPQLRGPQANGQSEATGLPLTWSEKENVKWKTPIHGKGWSSPVVWGDQIWLTTAPADGKENSAICVDKQSGQILLDLKLWENDKPSPLGNCAQLLCLALAGHRRASGLCHLRQLRHGLPRHGHRQGAVGAPRPAVRAFSRAGQLADPVREPADPAFRRVRFSVRNRPRQSHRPHRLEDRPPGRLRHRQRRRDESLQHAARHRGGGQAAAHQPHQQGGHRLRPADRQRAVASALHQLFVGRDAPVWQGPGVHQHGLRQSRPAGRQA